MQDLIPIRPAFWNVPLWAEIGVYVIGIAAVALCIAGIIRAIKLRRGNTPAEPVVDAQKRLLRTLAEIFWQKRIRDTASGKNHFLLFWGFIFLFLGTAIATIDWDIAWLVFGKRILTGNVYLVYKFALDLAGLIALGALAFSFWRRFISRDSKVEASPRFAIVLGSLAFIIITGFVLEALRLAVQRPEWADVSFVGNAIASLFDGIDPSTLKIYHTFTWVIHGLSALGFVASIPLTYYAHLFKTPTSIYHKKAEPRGALSKIENIEEQEHFGISEFDQFSRIERIRFDGCTECGRCTSVCPAVASGTPLDPKSVILSLKARMNGVDADKPLVGGLISKEALWSCTTCGACTKVCPAQIPTPDIIVQMRRHLALEQGDFPEGLAQALENTSSVGNPWGMDPGSRLNWAKGLEVGIAKPGVEYDVLYWVGCSASYDRRAQKIARAMIEIFRAANVKFAVMSEERCHGEFARRAGEEYLFQTAAAENIESLSRYNFKRIVAACPHCFNTLKNEYPQFEGGKFDVISHVQFITELLEQGRISPKLASKGSITFHDACYLARHNGIGRDPRTIFEKIGVHLKEPEKRGCNAVCCGAGGAQIFMDKPSRINIIRLEQLNHTASDEIAVSCPHCLTMLTSAQAQTCGRDETPKPVRDIAEIVAQAIADSTPETKKD